jgi:hypothetical protein
MNVSDPESTQWRVFSGVNRSPRKPCPRWPSRLAHTIWVRTPSASETRFTALGISSSETGQPAQVQELTCALRPIAGAHGPGEVAVGNRLQGLGIVGDRLGGRTSSRWGTPGAARGSGHRRLRRAARKAGELREGWAWVAPEPGPPWETGVVPPWAQLPPMQRVGSQLERRAPCDQVAIPSRLRPVDGG